MNINEFLLHAVSLHDDLATQVNEGKATLSDRIVLRGDVPFVDVLTIKDCLDILELTLSEVEQRIIDLPHYRNLEKKKVRQQFASTIKLLETVRDMPNSADVDGVTEINAAIKLLKNG